MHRRITRVALLLAMFAVPAMASGQAVSSPETLTGENATPLQISGFGVADYRADGRTRENAFGAGKLALSLFRPITQSLWVFGQLTTSVSADPSGDEATAEIEIDNLLVNFTPARWSSVSIAAGKFDTPIGFERDDEPLNLQPTTSFNYDLARPPKMVGVIARWSAGPRVDVAGWVANGWTSDVEPNHGKTVGSRLGFRPTEHTSIGGSLLYGPEGEQGSTVGRYLVTIDYALEPGPNWIIGGEGNYGGNRAGVAGPDQYPGAKWYGATATVFRRLRRNVGTTARFEEFRDRDGARTGIAQTLASVSIAPVYFLGVGGEGIFANVEHTTFRIPRFQLRGEIRFDHSTEPVLASGTGDVPWTVRYIAQLVTTF